ncbi:MAG: LacI family DNA-binding transcriptional regulator [Firmicutes bacterium]|nr:LacI family DNA-binding transcriptional regulator [Bacillota bacterium]
MATIHDVARVAGVSIATVSRVINDTGYVKHETRERVDAAIAQLDFHPSAIGRNLRQSKTNIVMVIVPEITNPFVGDVVRHIELYARSFGYSILLHEYMRNGMTAEQTLRFVEARRIDGMIFLTAEAKLKEFEQLSAKWPTVLACEYVDHLAIASVSIDNIAATLDVMHYLLALGHRDILLVNGAADNISSRDRLRGYRIALEQAGLALDPAYVYQAVATPESAYACVSQALRAEMCFTAVFCVSDVLAIGAIKALRDHGLNVPTDVSVVGFDDIAFAAFLDPPLTTVRQPAGEIAKRAMEMWMQVCAGESAQYPVLLRHELIIRSSCAQKRT